MKRELSGKLSPKAKKAVLTARPEALVTGLVHVSPAADRAALQQAIEATGTVVRSWLAQGGAVSVEAPAGRLEELAGLRDVVYVEAAERYSR